MLNKGEDVEIRKGKGFLLPPFVVSWVHTNLHLLRERHNFHKIVSASGNTPVAFLNHLFLCTSLR